MIIAGASGFIFLLISPATMSYDLWANKQDLCDRCPVKFLPG